MHTLFYIGYFLDNTKNKTRTSAVTEAQVLLSFPIKVASKLLRQHSRHFRNDQLTLDDR